ncbi:MAG: DUF3048 domain-containing protein [Clostridiales bacterium]|nr:DUF3048 domain-containing protein [Clostridiales bacterium]
MKKVLSLVLVLAMLLAMAGCATAQAEEPEESAEASVVEVEVEPVVKEDESEPEEEAFDWSYINPLTGEATEEDISNNRPIAIMLNNIKQALPQYGNSQADVLYEVPEEGGITRIMALYQDVTDVGTIGTIRSTRPYYVRLAVAADSILVHAGGSTAAYNVIKDYMEKYGLVDLDYLSKGTRTADIFYRDSSRLASGYASEHTLFTTSDNIQTYLEEHSDEIRLEHKDDYEYVHYFVEDGTPANGDTAESINVSFSGYKGTTFTYDSEAGNYKVSEFDSAYVDGTTGSQVSVENVVIIQTTIEALNDAKNHVAVHLTGTGSGYFACNGKYEKITWRKDKAKYTYQFYDEDGNVVDLGVGKTYVCIVGTERDITVDGVVLETPEDAEETEDLANFEVTDDNED